MFSCLRYNKEDILGKNQEVSDMAEQNMENQLFNSIILLRDRLISNLLGEDIDEILYWAGKDLAREQTVETESEIIDHFDRYLFGSLILIEEKKNRRVYKLTGEVVRDRLVNSPNPSFSLETGYLSQQLQSVLGIFSEGIFEIRNKQKEVLITIQMDPKEPLSSM